MPSALASQWSLDPSITFLNHGSFGACPTAVLDRQALLRAEMEREPVRFMLSLGERLTGVRAALAIHLGADPEDLALVPNATTGVNTVLRSLILAEHDEIVLTNHTYNACRNAAEWAAARSGATVRVVGVPFPLESPAQVTQAVLDAVTPRTRLVLLDHVTSPTGLIFPLEEIVPALTQRGIETLIDGAHAPGMVPLDLETLGATYYTGNCHKWMCAPKGAAFLHVRRDAQPGIVPLTISHGLNDVTSSRSTFRRLFDWVGTIDPTAYLSIPKALEVVAGFSSEGWPGIHSANHRLAIQARDLLTDALGVDHPAPDSMLGSLVAIPIQVADARPVGHQGYLPVAAEVLARGFEVPIFGWSGQGGGILRVSAQLYNSLDDYEALAGVLVEVLRQDGSESMLDHHR